MHCRQIFCRWLHPPVGSCSRYESIDSMSLRTSVKDWSNYLIERSLEAAFRGGKKTHWPTTYKGTYLCSYFILLQFDSSMAECSVLTPKQSIWQFLAGSIVVISFVHCPTPPHFFFKAIVMCIKFWLNWNPCESENKINWERKMASYQLILRQF